MRPATAVSRLLSWAAAVAVVVAVVVAGALLIRDDGPESAPPPGGLEPGAGSGPGVKPNLLVVMVDDQTTGSFSDEIMPGTAGFFGDGGSVFEEAIAAPPLCCPARAAFLTGRYAHNNGVVENDVGYATMRGKNRTFPVALQAAGYRTGMIGKFLNGYDRENGAAPAPGFGRWYAMLGSAEYRDFEVSDQGKRRFEPGYSTRVLTDEARRFIRRDGERPFFLWLSYNAPHTVQPGNPPPCDGRNAQPPGPLGPDAGAELPRPPSFNQRDTSDRPSLADHPPRMGRGDIADTTRAWRCSLAAMRAVDAQLTRLLGALERSGRLEETVVVYLSDNGYFYGEHRLTDDKRLPLEAALRVPMAIRVGTAAGAGVPDAPESIGELVSQVDLAPTLLDYARADRCPRGGGCPPLDGRSLRPLLEGETGAWPADRAIPLSLEDGWTYEALRTPELLYMEIEAARKRDFERPQEELYDLSADPDQLGNLAAAGGSANAARLKRLERRLSRLVRCEGIEGRDRRRGAPYCE